jgi:hypothetical protein
VAFQSALSYRPAAGSPSNRESTWEVIETALSIQRIVFAVPCTWAAKLLCLILSSLVTTPRSATAGAYQRSTNVSKRVSFSFAARLIPSECS